MRLVKKVSSLALAAVLVLAPTVKVDAASNYYGKLTEKEALTEIVKQSNRAENSKLTQKELEAKVPAQEEAVAAAKKALDKAVEEKAKAEKEYAEVKANNEKGKKDLKAAQEELKAANKKLEEVKKAYNDAKDKDLKDLEKAKKANNEAAEKEVKAYAAKIEEAQKAVNDKRDEVAREEALIQEGGDAIDKTKVETLRKELVDLEAVLVKVQDGQASFNEKTYAEAQKSNESLEETYKNVTVPNTKALYEGRDTYAEQKNPVGLVPVAEKAVKEAQAKVDAANNLLAKNSDSLVNEKKSLVEEKENARKVADTNFVRENGKLIRLHADIKNEIATQKDAYARIAELASLDIKITSETEKQLTAESKEVINAVNKGQTTPSKLAEDAKNANSEAEEANKKAEEVAPKKEEPKKEEPKKEETKKEEPKKEETKKEEKPAVNGNETKPVEKTNTKGNSSNPKTGDVSMIAPIATLILASGALVVSKKRK